MQIAHWVKVKKYAALKQLSEVQFIKKVTPVNEME